MRTITFLPLSLPFALVATLSAQTVVLPSAANTTRPTVSPFYTSNVFYSTSSATTAPDSHSQSIVDVQDVGMPAAVWNSLAVRRPVGLGNANNAFTANATIVMSVSPTAALSATNTFATNHGPNTTTVLSGQISLPAATNPTAWPAPWQTPFPFTTPFVFSQAMGQSLVIDILQTGNTATTPWYVEYTSPDLGGRQSNGSAPSNCKFSNGNYSNSLSHVSNVIPGGTWYVQYNNLLPNAPGFAWIGGNGTNSTWKGIPLPFDLGPFGAPNCLIHASPDIVMAMTTTASGSARWPNVTVPNDPSLGGLAFYDQSMWLDAAANALGAVVGWSSKWAIGTQIGAPGSFVYSIGNNAATSTTGTLAKGALPTFQLN